MKIPPPSYEYAVNMTAQYVMQAQASSDPVRQDILLASAIRWAKKARTAALAARQEG